MELINSQLWYYHIMIMIHLQTLYGLLKMKQQNTEPTCLPHYSRHQPSLTHSVNLKISPLAYLRFHYTKTPVDECHSSPNFLSFCSLLSPSRKHDTPSAVNTVALNHVRCRRKFTFLSDFPTSGDEE